MILYKQVGWIPLMCTHELSLLGAIAKTSSMGAQYVTMQNYFWHQDYLCLHFSSNRTHKTKIGTANRWEMSHVQ
jgi:hypothetical protein